MNKTSAVKWFQQALHDLEMAERNISIEGYDVSAFLCEQAVEKLLKTIFILQDKKMPRTHYIDELASELHLSDEILDDIFELSGDYTFSRYPDVADVVPFRAYSKIIAEGKVSAAKRVFEILKPLVTVLEENND